MVWGIETLVPHGEWVTGSGAAARYHDQLQHLVDDLLPPAPAAGEPEEPAGKDPI